MFYLWLFFQFGWKGHIYFIGTHTCLHKAKNLHWMKYRMCIPVCFSGGAYIASSYLGFVEFYYLQIWWMLLYHRRCKLWGMFELWCWIIFCCRAKHLHSLCPGIGWSISIVCTMFAVLHCLPYHWYRCWNHCRHHW